MGELYKKFRASMGRDGPDFSIIEEASGPDRTQLENDLIENLNFEEILALGKMNSKKSLPHLKNKLKKSKPLDRAACGRAIWEITGQQKWIEPITAIVTNRRYAKTTRIWAIGLLFSVKTLQTYDALEFALSDPNYDVRRQAASIYSYNVSGRCDDRTLNRNIKEFDQKTIQRYAKRLRAKIDL